MAPELSGLFDSLVKGSSRSAGGAVVKIKSYDVSLKNLKEKE